MAHNPASAVLVCFPLRTGYQQTSAHITTEFSFECKYERERKKRGKASRKELAARETSDTRLGADSGDSADQFSQPSASQDAYYTAPTSAVNKRQRTTSAEHTASATHQVSKRPDASFAQHPMRQQQQAMYQQPQYPVTNIPAVLPAHYNTAQPPQMGPFRPQPRPEAFQYMTGPSQLPPVSTQYQSQSYNDAAYQAVRRQSSHYDRPTPRLDGLYGASLPASGHANIAHNLPSPASQSGTASNHFRVSGSPISTALYGHPSHAGSPAHLELPSPRGALYHDQHDALHDQWLRYPVLSPLLPRLTAIMPVSLACDLLDVYFSSSSPSCIQPASPYILAFPFRKRSVLRSRDPRPCSKALLAGMLWVGAQTSESSFLTSPVSQRAKVCHQLLELSINLLNPLVHVPTEGSFAHRTNTLLSSVSPSGLGVAHLAAKPDAMGGAGSGSATLDDVMAYITIATVISASEHKAASVRWWTAAFSLARELKLGGEQTVTSNPTNGLNSASRTEDGPVPDDHHNHPNAPSQTTPTEETREERRRTWWLLYAVDRHIALCYNRPLFLRDADCENLRQPEADVLFQAPEHYPEQGDSQSLLLRPRGPFVECTGHGIFGYFLPLMTILGYIVDLNFAKDHPLYGVLFRDTREWEEQAVVITAKLNQYGASLANFEARCLASVPPGSVEIDVQTKTVVAYGTHLMHTLHIALNGKWDPISLLDDNDLWLQSRSFVSATNYAVSAADAISDILEYDPDLSFMPFFFGIYLLQGSFLLLLIADKLRGDASPDVVRACETVVRAHEVCVVTLNTEYQVGRLL